MKEKVVLVTGAGSGIGLALTRQLLERTKFRVVATARPKALKELTAAGVRESPRCMLRPLDVLFSHSRKNLIDEIEQKWDGVDTLVNNAGISFRSSAEDMDSSEEELQMATNYFGPFGLIKEVLPGMRKKRAGQIINVSSVGGMMAMPTMGSYSASKFALEGATEALWYELRPWGISVSLIQPGMINSNSFRKVYRSAKSRTPGIYDEYYRQMETFIEKLMTRTLATSDSVAAKMLKVIENGKGPLRVPATFDAHIFSFFRKFIPREIYHRILYSSLPQINHWVHPAHESEASPPAGTIPSVPFSEVDASVSDAVTVKIAG